MAEVVLDTTVLIDWSRGVAAVRDFAAARPPRLVFRLHAVTAAEFLAGLRNKTEQRQGETMLSQFRLLLPSPADFRHCLVLMRGHRLSHGVGWPDCLIAATCLRLGYGIVTLNEKHFRAFRGLRVTRPY